MKRLILIISGFTIIAIVFLYAYINKDHRNISAEKAEFTFTADELFEELNSATTGAEQKYFDKVIAVNGTLREIATTDNGKLFVIQAGNGTVSGEVTSLNNDVRTNEPVMIKGLFTGYDDLLNEIKLRECSILPLNQ